MNPFDLRGPEFLGHRDGAVRAALRAPVAALRAQGLIAGESETQARGRLALGAGVVLVGVAAVKLVLAIQRGRSNVLFLIVMAGLFVWGLSTWARKQPLSREGRRVLRDLRTLFGTRGARVPTSPLEGSASELLLAASVGGIVGGPFFVPPIARRESGSGSGCGALGGGSSCGGSSCGGGCGGGGCGGCGS